MTNISIFTPMEYPQSPEILSGVEPKEVGELLRRKSHDRNDQQVLNAWRKWRAEVWRAEEENESRLKILFRSMLAFHREGDTKSYDSIGMFILSTWGIMGDLDELVSNNRYRDIAHQRAVYPWLTDEWRDPQTKR